MQPAKFGSVSYNNGAAVYQDNAGNQISEDEWYQANDRQSPISMFRGDLGATASPVPQNMQPAKFGSVSYNNGIAAYQDSAGNPISEDEWYQANGAKSPISMFRGNLGTAAPQLDGSQNRMYAASAAAQATPVKEVTGLASLASPSGMRGPVQNAWGAQPQPARQYAPQAGAQSEYGAVPPDALYGSMGQFGAKQNDFIRRYQSQMANDKPAQNSWGAPMPSSAQQGYGQKQMYPVNQGNYGGFRQPQPEMQVQQPGQQVSGWSRPTTKRWGW